MHIAYICADRGVPIFGCKGCSIHVQEVVRAMRKRGHKVTIFAARLGGDPPLDLADVPITRLPKVPKDDPVLREQAQLENNEHLRNVLESDGTFDLVYERYSLWNFSAIEYARDREIPGILEVNAPLIKEQAQYREIIHFQEAQQIAQRVFATASTLVAVSQEIADYLASYLGTQNRIQVIPNGVNPDRFEPSPHPVASSFTVGFVGTMKNWHGLPVLAEAFTQLYEQYPQAHLMMVGEGPARATMEATLKERHLAPAVTWQGRVSPEKIPSLLTRLDVAVAPYPRLEEFYFSPLKVYEYMATGLPVVASDVGQLRQIIQPESNGLFFPAGDATALGTQLKRLAEDSELRKRLGQAARETILTKHTWDHRVNQILDLACNTSLTACKEVN